MPKMVWIWQGALHACFFLRFCFFGDRVRVHVAAHAGGGGGNRLGDARRAPTYAVRKLRACVCECVCVYAPAPLCRVPVCTTRLAFAGSNSAGRGTCCLARVCVRAFVFGFVLMQFLFFFFRLLLICYCFNSVGGEGGGGGLNHHPAVCRATSASASVCESCVCHVVAVWSRVRRRFGSSAGRILNVYTYTYTYVYVRACNCVRLNMFSRVPGILHIVNLE